jgi:hypothetical protein
MADRPHKSSLGPSPAAASRVTDEESGTADEIGGEALRRSLFALDAMRQRGLIDEATWQERRRALIAADKDPEQPNSAPSDGE